MLLKPSEIKELTRLLGYSFRDPGLLGRAFLHASYVNEQGDPGLRDNERLEFLGDAVLDLAVSHLLMERFPDAPEGDLSRYRAMLVDEAGLRRIARHLDLGRFLRLGRGEEQTNGRDKPSILASTAEALIGALYLDAGFPAAFGIIRRLFTPLIDRVAARDLIRDFKSVLQEYTQRVYRALPEYQLLEECGPAHDRTFRVRLTLKDRVLAEGEGRSKKSAEQMAAREAFFCLKKD